MKYRLDKIDSIHFVDGGVCGDMYKQHGRKYYEVMCSISSINTNCHRILGNQRFLLTDKDLNRLLHEEFIYDESNRIFNFEEKDTVSNMCNITVTNERTSYEMYKKESDILSDMFRCAVRYLSERKVSEEQQNIDKRIQADIHELYHKYIDELEQKCRAHTGKSLNPHEQLAKSIGGEIITLEPGSGSYINPFDLEQESEDKTMPTVADLIKGLKETGNEELSNQIEEGFKQYCNRRNVSRDY